LCCCSVGASDHRRTQATFVQGNEYRLDVLHSTGLSKFGHKVFAVIFRCVEEGSYIILSLPFRYCCKDCANRSSFLNPKLSTNTFLAAPFSFNPFCSIDFVAIDHPKG